MTTNSSSNCNIFLSANAVVDVFLRFAAVSVMKFNMRLRARACDRLPTWPGVGVADAGKYLGFMVGPGKGHRSWDKPLRKFSARATLWGSQALGLHYGARAYNTFALPVLSFVFQLEDPPDEAFRAEAHALACAATGPSPAFSA